jgi:hypothetical protein
MFGIGMGMVKPLSPLLVGPVVGCWLLVIAGVLKLFWFKPPFTFEIFHVPPQVPF